MAGRNAESTPSAEEGEDQDSGSVFPPHIRARLKAFQDELNAKAEAQRKTDTAPKQTKQPSTVKNGMKKGGSVKGRGDGIAQRGHTKGRFI